MKYIQNTNKNFDMNVSTKSPENSLQQKNNTIVSRQNLNQFSGSGSNSFSRSVRAFVGLGSQGLKTSAQQSVNFFGNNSSGYPSKKVSSQTSKIQLQKFGQKGLNGITSQSSLLTAQTQQNIQKSLKKNLTKQSKLKSGSRSHSQKRIDKSASQDKNQNSKFSQNKAHKKQADKFYRTMIIRKYFCVWIEKQIETLKAKTLIEEDNQNEKNQDICQIDQKQNQQKHQLQHKTKSQNNFRDIESQRNIEQIPQQNFGRTQSNISLEQINIYSNKLSGSQSQFKNQQLSSSLKFKNLHNSQLNCRSTSPEDTSARNLQQKHILQENMNTQKQIPTQQRLHKGLRILKKYDNKNLSILLNEIENKNLKLSHSQVHTQRSNSASRSIQKQKKYQLNKLDDCIKKKLNPQSKHEQLGNNSSNYRETSGRLNISDRRSASRIRNGHQKKASSNSCKRSNQLLSNDKSSHSIQSRSFHQKPKSMKDIAKLLVYKHFLLWKKVIIDEKKICKKKQKTSIDQGKRRNSSYFKNHLKALIFSKLKEIVLNKNRIKDKASQIRRQQRMYSIYKYFLKWIEQFNFVSIQKKKKFYANQHWIQTVKSKYFRYWIQKIYNLKLFRHQLRQVVPMRFIINLTTKYPKINIQNSQSTNPGQELIENLKYYKLDYVNEDVMYESVSLFKCNLIRSVFEKIKLNYLQILSFKAKIAMKMSRNVIQHWRYHLWNKNQIKNLQTQFNYNMVLATYKKMLYTWHTYSRYKKYLKLNQKKFMQQRLSNLKKNIIISIRNFSFQSNEKNMKNTKARKFYEEKNKNFCFNELSKYLQNNIQKKTYNQKITQKYFNKLQSQVFELMAQTCKKMSILNLKGKIQKQSSEKATKLRYLRDWYLESLAFSRSHIHYNYNLQKIYYNKLREGILIKLIDEQKNMKAHKFRAINLKVYLFQFLQEFPIEQENIRQIQNQIIQQAEFLKKKRIFMSFKSYYQKQKQIKQIQNQTLRYKNIRTKKLILKQLQINIINSFKINEKIYSARMNAKKQALENLRYASRKQCLLRQALIETLHKRNKQRAFIAISQWKTKAFHKIHFNHLLLKQTKKITVSRVFRKLRNIKQFRIQKQQIQNLCYEANKMRLFSKVWNAIQKYRITKQAINVNKAKVFRKKVLYSKSFGCLLQTQKQRKNYNKIKDKMNHKLKNFALNIWLKEVFTRQTKMKSFSFYNAKLIKKTFRTLTKRIQQRKKTLLLNEQAQIVKYFQLLKKVFFSFKFQKNILQDYNDHKEQKNSQSKIFYLKQIISNWRQKSRYMKANRIRFEKVNKMHQQIITKSYFSIMTQKFQNVKQQERAIEHHKISLIKKQFKYMKKQAIRNIQVNSILKKYKEKKEQNLKSNLFHKIKRNLYEQKWFKVNDIKAVAQLCKFMQTKSFHILKIFKNKSKNLESIKIKIQKKHEFITRQKFIMEMINTFIIERKLEKIGEYHYMKRKLQLFKKKISYIRDRNEGLNLHELEIKSFQMLAKNLLKKGLTSIKIYTQLQILKYQENQMAIDCNRRKWFNIWRQSFLIKSQQNYFSQIQNHSVHYIPNSGLPPRYINRENSRSNERNSKYSKQKENYNSLNQQQTQQAFQIIQQINPVKVNQEGTINDVQRTKQQLPQSIFKNIQTVDVDDETSQNKQQSIQVNQMQTARYSLQEIQKDDEQKSYNDFPNQMKTHVKPVLASDRSQKEHFSATEKAKMLSQKIKSRIDLSRTFRDKLDQEFFRLEELTFDNHEYKNPKQTTPDNFAEQSPRLRDEKQISNQNSPNKSPAQKSQPRQKNFQQNSSAKKRYQIGPDDFQLNVSSPYEDISQKLQLHQITEQLNQLLSDKLHSNQNGQDQQNFGSIQAFQFNENDNLNTNSQNSKSFKDFLMKKKNCSQEMNQIQDQGTDRAMFTNSNDQQYYKEQIEIENQENDKYVTIIQQNYN